MLCPYQLWRRLSRLELNSVFSCPAPGVCLLAGSLRQGASSQIVAMKKASKASPLPTVASGRCALEKD